jgi:hypothetical protein
MVIFSNTTQAKPTPPMGAEIFGHVRPTGEHNQGCRKVLMDVVRIFISEINKTFLTISEE